MNNKGLGLLQRETKSREFLLVHISFAHEHLKLQQHHQLD